MRLRNLFVAIALALTALAGAYVASRTEAPATPLSALVLPASNPVPEFSLLDQEGESVDQSVFQGQWDLVFFGFTHCPDICPATLQVLATAKKALADDGRPVLPRIVLVSVDPERDTPAILAEYVGYFGEDNLGLTGSLDEIRKLTDGLGIYFEKQAANGENYVVDHSAAVLVIDPDGGFHSLFSGPHVVDNYVHDLPLLMGGT
jgi:protein SCO1/2